MSEKENVILALADIVIGGVPQVYQVNGAGRYCVVQLIDGKKIIYNKVFFGIEKKSRDRNYFGEIISGEIGTEIHIKPLTMKEWNNK